MRLQSFSSLALATLVSFACSAGGGDAGEAELPAVDASIGQANVQDNESQPDIVKIAVGSADHTTLVTALKSANLVNSLANAGPFTVFAPTNAAFDKLPKGTVEDLLKPANADKLRNILQHHVTTSVFAVADLTDGMTLSMADGNSVTISKSGEEVTIDGAKIVASVRGSNGMVHVVDGVILPAAK
ncbi:MAG: fasciclin domain-containing protein [Gemmatimonadetes bacterium]|nr:fasciclin domain-containing protein [Gemmatimonadota bacterium]MCC6769611.1 fasciclin domain-containing protein [Gemmatimonadaceae bacterium]